MCGCQDVRMRNLWRYGSHPNIPTSSHHSRHSQLLQQPIVLLGGDVAVVDERFQGRDDLGTAAIDSALAKLMDDLGEPHVISIGLNASRLFVAPEVGKLLGNSSRRDRLEFGTAGLRGCHDWTLAQRENRRRQSGEASAIGRGGLVGTKGKFKGGRTKGLRTELTAGRTPPLGPQ